MYDIFDYFLNAFCSLLLIFQERFHFYLLFIYEEKVKAIKNKNIK